MLADRRPHLAFSAAGRRLALRTGCSFAPDGGQVGLAARACRAGLDLARWPRAPVGADLAAAGPVDVRELLLVAGRVGLVRRALARVGRAGCRAAPRCCCRTARRCSSLASPSETVCEPPPVWKRTYMPLPSVFWPSPAMPDQRVEELLVVLRAGRELVLDRRGRRPGSTTSRRHLDARSVCGSSSVARSISSRQVGASRARAPRPARRARPCRRARGVCSIHGNAASIVAGVSRTPGPDLASRTRASAGTRR